LEPQNLGDFFPFPLPFGPDVLSPPRFCGQPVILRAPQTPPPQKGLRHLSLFFFFLHRPVRTVSLATFCLTLETPINDFDLRAGLRDLNHFWLRPLSQDNQMRFFLLSLFPPIFFLTVFLVVPFPGPVFCGLHSHLPLRLTHDLFCRTGSPPADYLWPFLHAFFPSFPAFFCANRGCCSCDPKPSSSRGKIEKQSIPLYSLSLPLSPCLRHSLCGLII